MAEFEWIFRVVLQVLDELARVPSNYDSLSRNLLSFGGLCDPAPIPIWLPSEGILSCGQTKVSPPAA